MRSAYIKRKSRYFSIPALNAIPKVQKEPWFISSSFFNTANSLNFRGSYPACFFKEDDGCYSVVFPDLNGLSTCGETLNDAFEAATDCLAGYIYTSKREGEEVPAPSVMADINLTLLAGELEVTVEGAFVNMVSVDVDAYAKMYFEKAVKKTLTIPAWLNKAAIEKKINFSQVLQEALMEKIQEK